MKPKYSASALLPTIKKKAWPRSPGNAKPTLPETRKTGRQLLRTSQAVEKPKIQGVEKGRDARQPEEARADSTFAGYGKRAPTGLTTQIGLSRRPEHCGRHNAFYLSLYAGQKWV